MQLVAYRSLDLCFSSELELEERVLSQIGTFPGPFWCLSTGDIHYFDIFSIYLTLI